jgi:hypothetical protein
MKSTYLNERQCLAITVSDKKVRLVVTNDGVENVCRLQTLKNLKDFADLTNGYLFKGRLQLHKNRTAVQVIVKGEIVGVIREESVKNLFV